MRKFLLLATTTALVAGVGGTAYAESFTATSLVQRENGNCGRYFERQPIIGSAKFTRTFNRVKITYKAKHLAKLETYEMSLWNATAGTCEFLGAPARFVTTATGAGSVTGEMEVPEKDNEFFATAEGGFAPFVNDSFTVVLPRP